MSESTSTSTDLSSGIEAINLSTPSKLSSNSPIFSSQPPFDQQKDKIPKYFGAEYLSQQPFMQTIDHVRHRMRGILITQDTYQDFMLSFPSDREARTFLGDLLIAMSQSANFLRMSESELEEMNASWDDDIRPNYSPRPTEMEVTMVYEVVYHISTKAELVKTVYYAALTSSFKSYLAEIAICRRELNGLWNGAARAKAVKPLHFNRHSQQRESAEDELELAIESCRSTDTRRSNSVPTLVEALIKLTKVGRRERAETFLNIGEARISRLLPREQFKNFSKCVKFVYWVDWDSDSVETDDFNPDKCTHHLRGFILRRPIGSINKTEMDSALVSALKASTEVKSVLGCQNHELAIDRFGSTLLRCRNGIDPEPFQTIRTMFS